MYGVTCIKERLRQSDELMVNDKPIVCLLTCKPAVSIKGQLARHPDSLVWFSFVPRDTDEPGED